MFGRFKTTLWTFHDTYLDRKKLILHYNNYNGYSKNSLVTASAGIGKATAILLAQNGTNVYGVARKTEKIQDLKGYGINPV